MAKGKSNGHGKRWGTLELLQAADKLGQGERVRRELDEMVNSLTKKTNKNSDLKDSFKDLALIDNPKNTSIKKNSCSKIDKKISNIKTNLSMNNAQARLENEWLALYFPNCSLLTTNELLRMNPYKRSGYMKLCHQMVEQAVQSLMLKEKPRFNGKVQVILFRSGESLVDLDAMGAMFKGLIDGLVVYDILKEDNPDVAADIKYFQQKGNNEIILKIKKIREDEEVIIPQISWENISELN